MTDKRWAFVIFLVAIVAGLVWQGLDECNECRGGSCPIIIDDPSESGIQEVAP